MAVMRNVQEISVRKVGRKDSLFKLGRSWEDNIEIERRI
jgi:hypothetical protein